MHRRLTSFFASLFCATTILVAGGGETPQARAAQLKEINRERVIMARKFEVFTVLDMSLPARNRFMQRLAPDLALDRIETLEKFWSPEGEESDIARINSYAGLLPVKLKEETFQLLKRTVQACKDSNRAFDPTFYVAGKLFKIPDEKPKVKGKYTQLMKDLKVAKKEKFELPQQSAVNKAQERIDCRLIELIETPPIESNILLTHHNNFKEVFEVQEISYVLDDESLELTTQAQEAPNSNTVTVHESPIVPGTHRLLVDYKLKGNSAFFSYVEDFEFTMRAAYTFEARPERLVKIEVTTGAKDEVFTDIRDRPYVSFETSSEPYNPVGRYSVRLAKAGMQLSVSGNWKGAAMDEAAKVLKEHGIERFMIRAGDDMITSGLAINGPWSTEVPHPRRDPDSKPAVIQFPAGGGAIATSGSFDRFVNVKGQRYHPVINTKTGKPSTENIAATVAIAGSDNAGELADTWATALMVLGPKEGFKLLKKVRGAEAAIYTVDGKLHRTSGFLATLPETIIMQDL